MLLADFDYELPPELIAQTPIEPRNASRLMVLDPGRQSIDHRRFFELGDFLAEGDALIFNDTRVIPARLIGHKDTGGRVEVFLLNRREGDDWETLVKPGKKAQPGTVINFGPELGCRVLERTEFGGRVVRFCYDGLWPEILAKLGEVPLPPYIHQKLSDTERYQTVYSRCAGSAAAPTAGLHFTAEDLARLKERGINLGFVTLHVGLGTFRPVQTETIEEHVMHREFYSIPEKTAELIRNVKEKGGRIIAVGTTSLRTLEAASVQGLPAPGSGWTDIFIYPGYKFRITDGLVTNFHLPKSTLLMLVSALAGREFILTAYREAVREKYRFFSFGDAMFIKCRQEFN